MYYKLFGITFNNKKFLLFGGDQSVDYRILFLELKEDGTIDYPELSDYEALNEIYNKKDYIKYAEKKPMSQKARIKSTILSVLMAADLLALAHVAKPAFSTLGQLVKSINHEVVTDRESFSSFFQEEVTREDVVRAISENRNIPDKYKHIAVEVLDVNLELDPEMDLHLFYENIKRMSFQSVYRYDIAYLDMCDHAAAWYNIATGRIFVYKEYEDDEGTIFHEINHAAHDIMILKDDIFFEINDSRGQSLEEAMTEKIKGEAYNPWAYETQRRFLNYFLLNTKEFNYSEYNKAGIPGLIDELKVLYPDVDIDYIITYLDAWTRSNNANINEIKHYNFREFQDELFKIAIANINLNNPYGLLYSFSDLFMNEYDYDTAMEYFRRYNQALVDKGCSEIYGSFKLKEELYAFRKGLLKESELDNEYFESIFEDVLNNMNRENAYQDLDIFVLLLTRTGHSNMIEENKYIERYDEKIASLGYLTEEQIQQTRSINNMIRTEEGEYCWCVDPGLIFSRTGTAYGYLSIPFGVEYHATIFDEDGISRKTTLPGDPLEVHQMNDSYEQDCVLRYLVKHPEANLYSKETKEGIAAENSFFDNRKCNMFTSGEEAFPKITPDMFVEIGLDENGKIGFKLMQGEKCIYSTCDHFSGYTSKIPYSIYTKFYCETDEEEEKSVDRLLSEKYLSHVKQEFLSYYCPNLSFTETKGEPEKVHRTYIDIDGSSHTYNSYESPMIREYEFESPITLILDGNEVPIQDVFFYVNFSKDGMVTQEIYTHIPGEEDTYIGDFGKYPADVTTTVFLRDVLRDINYPIPENRTIDITRQELGKILNQFLYQTDTIVGIKK